MKNMHRKAITASEKFLERKGCEIIATSWKAPDGFETVDIIAADKDVIAFVDVKAVAGADGFLENDNTRGKREILAAKWSMSERRLAARRRRELAPYAGGAGGVPESIGRGHEPPHRTLACVRCELSF